MSNFSYKLTGIKIWTLLFRHFTEILAETFLPALLNQWAQKMEISRKYTILVYIALLPLKKMDLNLV